MNVMVLCSELNEPVHQIWSVSNSTDLQVTSSTLIFRRLTVSEKSWNRGESDPVMNELILSMREPNTEGGN